MLALSFNHPFHYTKSCTHPVSEDDEHPASSPDASGHFGTIHRPSLLEEVSWKLGGAS